jgi:hypothetical protein
MRRAVSHYIIRATQELADLLGITLQEGFVRSRALIRQSSVVIVTLMSAPLAGPPCYG